MLQADVLDAPGSPSGCAPPRSQPRTACRSPAHCAPSAASAPGVCGPNIRHLEYFADHVRVDHLLFDGVIEQTQGTLEPDLSRAGLGLELKRADAEPFLKHG